VYEWVFVGLAGRFERWDEVVHDLNQCIFNDRDSLHLLTMRAMAKASLQLFEEALEDAEIMLSKNRSAENYCFRARLYGSFFFLKNSLNRSKTFLLLGLSRQWEKADLDYQLALKYKRDCQEALDGLEYVR